MLCIVSKIKMLYVGKKHKIKSNHKPIFVINMDEFLIECIRFLDSMDDLCISCRKEVRVHQQAVPCDMFEVAASYLQDR